MKITSPSSDNLPLVSVVTVNYNQSGVTCEFLNSLKQITYPRYEVFVVDNASPSDNPDLIKDQFPWITLLKTDQNLGFAGGNNVALPFCKGKYILFINNDTEVEPGFLEPLVNLLESNREIGMVSPRIQYFYSEKVLQFAGFTPFNMVTTRNFAVGFGEQDKGQYNDTRETGSIFGAAMLVPMKVIEEVGMMADVYFLYYEEHDWAAHIKKAGYKIYYCGASLVLHKESISTVKNSPFQIYYLTRGRMLFARRNTRGITKFLSILYLNFVTLPKITISFILKRRPDLVWAYWKAVVWNITHQKGIVFEMPKLVKK
ncbi:MAG: glycosyltransferase family 2 protein [Bacteroidales bacterium]|nr:glycosyltransferase family 2 protein [Bacteroidales bacterium]